MFYINQSQNQSQNNYKSRKYKYFINYILTSDNNNDNRIQLSQRLIELSVYIPLNTK